MRGDVLLDLCIVGIFHITQVYKAAAYPYNASQNDDGEYDV